MKIQHLTNWPRVTKRAEPAAKPVGLQEWGLHRTWGTWASPSLVSVHFPDSPGPRSQLAVQATVAEETAQHCQLSVTKGVFIAGMLTAVRVPHLFTKC